MNIHIKVQSASLYIIYIYIYIFWYFLQTLLTPLTIKPLKNPSKSTLCASQKYIPCLIQQLSLEFLFLYLFFLQLLFSGRECPSILFPPKTALILDTCTKPSAVAPPSKVTVTKAPKGAVRATTPLNHSLQLLAWQSLLGGGWTNHLKKYYWYTPEV